MSLILRVRVQLINGHLALAADEETFAHDTSWMPTWDFTVFQNSSTLVQGSHSKCVLIFRKVYRMQKAANEFVALHLEPDV